MRRIASIVAPVVVAAVFAAGGGACAGDGAAPDSAARNDPDPSPSTRRPTRRFEGTLTVSAATSLTDAFTEIGEEFMAAHPDVDVRFNFAASSALAAQIAEGAPADLFASADEANMDKVADPGLLAADAQIFASNRMVIVTKPGNPAGIDDLADLADLAAAGVVSLCAPEVPCGRYAAEVLGNAGVTIDESNVTRGQNVGATLTAVTEGDAVAAIVYETDAAGVGDAVDAVDIPDDVNAIATYPIGVIAATPYPDVADAFLEWVLGPEGQAVLERHGFLPPT